MDRISGLPDDLLVKILSSVPTKIAVSTSILSKRWGSLWKWVPKLDAHCWEPALVDFISKNLPLRATIIESLCLVFDRESFQLEDIKLWIGTAVSHCLRELSINYFSFTLFDYESDLLFPRSLYTCISLVTLELIGRNILVDVPLKGCLPSLKTLQLCDVTYSNQDSLQLLLSYCFVLENLVIQRDRSFENSRDADDNLRAIVVIVPSLQRLTLELANSCTDDGYEIVTPSLKYLKFEVYADIPSNMIASMPKLEEADINVEGKIEKLLTSVTSAKRLALYQTNHNIKESEYCEVCAGIVFDQLEQLKLDIFTDDWSSLLVWLLKNSPKLRVLNLHVDADSENFQTYQSADWKENGSSAPKCLKRSLETLEFTGYSGRLEERDVLSFIFQNARCLKSISISHWSTTDS